MHLLVYRVFVHLTHIILGEFAGCAQFQWIEGGGEQKQQLQQNTMRKECSIDGSLSLLGGTIFHLIVGIKTMWGNITPYVVSESAMAFVIGL